MLNAKRKNLWFFRTYHTVNYSLAASQHDTKIDIQICCRYSVLELIKNVNLYSV